MPKNSKKIKENKENEDLCKNLSDLYNVCMRSINNKKECIKLTYIWYDNNCHINSEIDSIRIYPNT